MHTTLTERLKLIAGATVISLFSALLITPTVTAQTAQDQILTGIDEACAGGTCAADDGNLQDTVASVINILSVVVGVVAVVMVIIGGLKYVSSQGDSSGISSAKNTITYALVGLVIVALSQVIVRFVVQRSTAEQVAPATAETQGQNGPTQPVIPASDR